MMELLDAKEKMTRKLQWQRKDAVVCKDMCCQKGSGEGHDVIVGSWGGWLIR